MILGQDLSKITSRFNAGGDGGGGGGGGEADTPTGIGLMGESVSSAGASNPGTSGGFDNSVGLGIMGEIGSPTDRGFSGISSGNSINDFNTRNDIYDYAVDPPTGINMKDPEQGLKDSYSDLRGAYGSGFEGLSNGRFGFELNELRDQLGTSGQVAAGLMSALGNSYAAPALSAAMGLSALARSFDEFGPTTPAGIANRDASHGTVNGMDMSGNSGADGSDNDVSFPWNAAHPNGIYGNLMPPITSPEVAQQTSQNLGIKTQLDPYDAALQYLIDRGVV